LAQLTERDIQVPHILQVVYADVIPIIPNLNYHNSFTDKMDLLRTTVDNAKIHATTFIPIVPA